MERGRGGDADVENITFRPVYSYICGVGAYILVLILRQALSFGKVTISDFSIFWY